ncbi:205 kDa microtubule-associated protein [Drosophila rhopaloa]|uniref:205 kDa microtubule-associated protein n=1 Tax=Drosophila rhopaloa TaxID=1041015 RepID=A0A6P4E6A0_DRORH|nr:205 kDa microtubule-associated protein [Drosophila rhopaloa]
MEHHEDNAQLDNYLQNRLSESLQISGGAGEQHLHVTDSAGEELSAPGIESSKSDQRDGDGDEAEEWKYINEVQQSEKLQQQQLPQKNGNGFGLGPQTEGLILGNNAAASRSLAFEEEDVEVIKNDGDLSTNSNTTTSTGEVAAQDPQRSQEANLLGEQQQQQQLQSQDQEDEDEPSSVATTYGTSSLSENNPTPLEQDEVVLVPQPAVQELLKGFDNKENCDYVQEQEESHSQLNPNAVAFVPSFGSQPSSPLSAVEEPQLGLPPRQLLGVGPLDDLVAESPRKGSVRENMDAIAVPDEREFDIEADKRPHELEQESDIFNAGNLEMQLLNGVGTAEPAALADLLDHGPETCVDMDLSLDQLPAGGDIMKQSLYAEHNASIEDILNSVQPLPTQTGDEKELLNVEEKEHVSQSPSTEELQFQPEQHRLPLFNNSDQDPMQASFYLEHICIEAQKNEQQELEQLPVEDSEKFADQSFLLDTSAPVFSPESNSPLAKLELESQQADIVDITPSPSASTEEKHLVEDTKELVEDPEVALQETRWKQESNIFESFPQEEVYEPRLPPLIDMEKVLASECFDSDHKGASKSVKQEELPDLLCKEQLLTAWENSVPQKDQPAEENIFVNKFVPIKEQIAAPEGPELSVASEGPELSIAPEESPVTAAVEIPIISQIEKAVLPIRESLVEAVPEAKKEGNVAAPLAVVATVAGAAVAVAAATNPSLKAKRSAPNAIKKTTTSSTTVCAAGATKPAAARPRTAPVATKTTSASTKSSLAATPTATTRKPLSSNAATKLSSTRPATAPVTKAPLGARTTASKTIANGTASANGSGSGARTTARLLASTAARKPPTVGTGPAAGVSGTARRPAANASGSGSAATKPRSAVTSAAPAKPNALSPHSNISATTSVRKAPSTNVTSLSARSPSKPASNGLGRSTSSTTATTTTTTTTKTFTARPAPRFTHSASSTNSNSTTRRLLVPGSSTAPTAANLRKSSPIKTTPVKTAAKPLTPKPKESATTKVLPAGLKARKSTALKGDSPIRAPRVAPPAEATLTTNGGINAEKANKENGLHDVQETQPPIQEQPDQDQVVYPQLGEVSLLDF